MLTPPKTNHELLARIKSEFLEMPGLRLNEVQARRMWGLDAESCASLLAELVSSKFLFQTREGAYMRIERATPSKATMPPVKRTAA